MVTTIPRYVETVRPYFSPECTDMLRVILNSASSVEANLALEVLRTYIPEKSLVTALNLREAIRDLPRCPISMAFDFNTLAGTWNLEPVKNSWRRMFEDPKGDYEIVLLGEGNLCYDIAVRTHGNTTLWPADDPEKDFIHPNAIELVMSRDTLLKTVVELVETMGLPFSPTFYLSLDDWHLEYAESIFAELDDAFRLDDTLEDDPFGGDVFGIEKQF